MTWPNRRAADVRSTEVESLEPSPQGLTAPMMDVIDHRSFARVIGSKSKSPTLLSSHTFGELFNPDVGNTWALRSDPGMHGLL